MTSKSSVHKNHQKSPKIDQKSVCCFWKGKFLVVCCKLWWTHKNHSKTKVKICLNYDVLQNSKQILGGFQTQKTHECGQKLTLAAPKDHHQTLKTHQIPHFGDYARFREKHTNYIKMTFFIPKYLVFDILWNSSILTLKNW